MACKQPPTQCPRRHTATSWHVLQARSPCMAGWHQASACQTALRPSHICQAADKPVGAAQSQPDSPQTWSLHEAGTRLEWQRPDLHMVLVSPQIPQNAGNVARTCAGTGVALHLVEPLGFQLDDAKLKRAGLDYWHSVAVKTHKSWQEFYSYFCQLPQPKRLVAFTVFADSYYAGPEFEYRPGDWLLFGAETSGLPPEAHQDILASGGALVKIPILDTHVRSLNLAVCAGVGVFEALRQLDAGSHQVAPRASPSFAETSAKYFPDSPLVAPPSTAGS